MFDFALGETVDDVTIVTGGAGDLQSSDLSRLELGVYYTPLENRLLTISATYTDESIDDEIAAFPSLTPNVEAAFPGRFIRDVSGQLVEIDSRPVNFAERDRRFIRYGFDVRKRLTGKKRGARGGSGARGEGKGRPEGAPRRPTGGVRGFGRPRGFFGASVFHSYIFDSSLRLAPGAANLDLLGGDAISLNDGEARHELTAQLRFFRQRLGGRADFTWRSGRTIDDGAGGVLDFSSLGVLNTRVYYRFNRPEPGEQATSFFDKSRIRLSVDNVFNDRQKVTDASGATPLNFQPALLDPLGRVVSLSFEKDF